MTHPETTAGHPAETSSRPASEPSRFDRWGNRILFSAETIRRRIDQLGAEITAFYKDSPRDLVVIAMLKGSLYFVADLTRRIDRPLTYDFTAIGTIGASKQSGIIRITRRIGIDIQGKDVLVLEEIIRTGLTTNLMIEHLSAMNPYSIQICTLLNNPEQTLIPLPVRFVGFHIGYERVAGYGIDLAEQGRTLPDLVLLDEHTVFPGKNAATPPE